MSIKINKLKLKKSGFTLVEILAAIVISSISLLAMIKISVEATKQSLKNQAADRATQIYSLTSQKLLDLKVPPLLSSSPFCENATPNSGPYREVYLGFDSSTPPKVNVFKSATDASINVNPTTYVSKDASQALASSNFSPPDYTIHFSQDNVMDQNDKDAGFYRAIGFQYSPVYKTLNVRIVIFWNMYGVDNYYVNYNIFNVDECLT